MLKHLVWQRWLVPSALAVLLSACVTTPVQPDYQAQIEQEQQTLSAWPAQQDAENAVYFTDLIQSKPLSALLDTAFSNNLGLQQNPTAEPNTAQTNQRCPFTPSQCWFRC